MSLPFRIILYVISWINFYLIPSKPAFRWRHHCPPLKSHKNESSVFESGSLHIEVHDRQKIGVLEISDRALGWSLIGLKNRRFDWNVEYQSRQNAVFDVFFGGILTLTKMKWCRHDADWTWFSPQRVLYWSSSTQRTLQWSPMQILKISEGAARLNVQWCRLPNAFCHGRFFSEN